VTGIAAGSIASDFAALAAYEFGWTDTNGNLVKVTSEVIWSQLLSGNDTINGSSGDDRQVLPSLNAGNDVFNMGAGNDYVGGSLGNDTINGGDGYDTLSFRETQYLSGVAATQGIVVDVAAGTVQDAFGFTDQVTGIEQYEGSAFADQFIGGAGVDNFRGLRGNDTFDGGANLSDHGDGGNLVGYAQDRFEGGLRGIIANLGVNTAFGMAGGTIRDGFGNIDTVHNIQSVIGTDKGDIFVGSTAQNVFSGAEGLDRYNGGAGEDVLWFFQNFDQAASHGINVNLSLKTGQIIDDGFGNTEIAISMEDVVGSESNDRIVGSAGANVLEGRHGADRLTGGLGADEFKYYWQGDLGQGDIITDFHAAAGPDRDRMQFFVSTWGVDPTLHLVNGTHANQAVATFIFNAATHVLSFDQDGTGAGAAIDVAVLNGVTALTAANFDLI
jgi:Ca2+-binding RTX toxin-like protein